MSNIETARRFLDAMNAGDGETAYSLLNDDVELVTRGGTLRGKETIRAAEEQGAGEHFEVEIRARQMSEDGDVVDARSTQVMRWKESGEVAHEQEARVRLTIRGGKISRLDLTPSASGTESEAAT